MVVVVLIVVLMVGAVYIIPWPPWLFPPVIHASVIARELSWLSGESSGRESPFSSWLVYVLTLLSVTDRVPARSS